jgi:hypothetical protein
MKKNTTLAIIWIALATLFTGCLDKGTICTDEFRSVMVKVESAWAAPVVVDEVYTTRKSTGEKISYPQDHSSGYYIVLDDSYQQKLKKDKDIFTFTGRRGGNIIFEETYEIKADACHISKISGKDTIRLN